VGMELRFEGGMKRKVCDVSLIEEGVRGGEWSTVGRGWGEGAEGNREAKWGRYGDVLYQLIMRPKIPAPSERARSCIEASSHVQVRPLRDHGQCLPARAGTPSIPRAVGGFPSEFIARKCPVILARRGTDDHCALPVLPPLCRGPAISRPRASVHARAHGFQKGKRPVGRRRSRTSAIVSGWEVRRRAMLGYMVLQALSARVVPFPSPIEAAPPQLVVAIVPSRFAETRLGPSRRRLVSQSAFADSLQALVTEESVASAKVSSSRTGVRQGCGALYAMSLARSSLEPRCAVALIACAAFGMITRRTARCRPCSSSCSGVRVTNPALSARARLARTSRKSSVFGCQPCIIRHGSPRCWA